MGITVEHQSDNLRADGLRVLRVSGQLRKNELDSALVAEAANWGPSDHFKVLIIVTDFKGWERGANWGDMTFFETHGDRMDKIAIVADDPRWKEEFLMFVGAGLRRAPVNFFLSAQLADARAWLLTG